MTSLHRLLLMLYPPYFRSRYGDELAATMEDLPSQRVAADLVRGAALAWFRPAFAGSADERRRQRLQSTATVVFVSWAAALCSVAAFSRGVDDQPIFAPTDAAHTLFSIVVWCNVALSVGALAAGALYWIVILRRAIELRQRGVIVPAIAPALIGAGWGLTALLASLVIGPTALAPGHVSAVVIVALLVFPVVTVVAVAGCVVSAAVAIRRAALPASTLAPAMLLAPIGALLLIGETVAAAACLATISWAHRDGVLLAECLVPAAALAVCAGIAAISAARGVSGLRRIPSV